MFAIIADSAVYFQVRKQGCGKRQKGSTLLQSRKAHFALNQVWMIYKSFESRKTANYRKCIHHYLSQTSKSDYSYFVITQYFLASGYCQGVYTL